MECPIFIYQYHPKSRSAYQLISGLRGAGVEALMIKSRNSNFKPSTSKTILNWGSRSKVLQDFGEKSPVINPVSAVEICSDKKKFLVKMNQHGVPHPEFTTSKPQAKEWAREGVVLAREVLTGHSGVGISFSDEGLLNDAPLYVKYIPKKEEYRIHVFRGKIIDIQQKRLRTTDDYGNKVDPDSINFRVRSYRNGFIFARGDVSPPETVLEVSKAAFKAVPDLDFGAFDVIYNKKQDQAYVLECNTAPGLEGTTVNNYVSAIQSIL